MQNFGGQPGELWSAHHLYGKPGNSGENSTGTVQPGENCPEKKLFLFYRNDRNFCLDYQCQALSRGKAESLPVFCKWYNSISFLFSVPKKIPVPFDGNFSPKFPYKW